jgi:hypothetical protein
MYRFQPLLAVVCCLVLVAPSVSAQTANQSPGNPVNPPRLETGRGPFSWLTRPYRQPEIRPVSLGNSNRLDSLLRAGTLYLSLQDTIALALENNLDIEVQRYGPQVADANILRARAGGFLRGVNASVTPGPTSATQTGPQTGINQSAVQQASNVQTTGNILVSQTGSAIPSLDPTIQGFMRFQHLTTPQSSAFVTGTNSLTRVS